MNGSVFPVCSKCENGAVIKQGHQWLYEKHYRFGSMRTKAKRDKKTVPTFEKLESILPDDVKCPSCKRKMNWRQKDGVSMVITLQHNRDGSIQLLCLSCNTRHAKRQGDSFYNENPETEKLCPKCGTVKPLNCFTTDNSKRWKNKKSLCKECANKAHDKWLKNNKEKQNEWRRKHYHRKKSKR
ncbi:MAG: hypothetical protein LBH43_12845 [Treponema sp.]|jgi:superfamily II helicase|nr:hypothetical protein [Treponema sp.]